MAPRSALTQGSCSDSGHQRRFAVVKTFSYFGHRIHPRLAVFVLNHCRDRIFLGLQNFEHAFDIGVALAQRHVRTVVLLAIFDVQREDLRVVFFQETYRIEAGGREVPDVEVDAGIFRAAGQRLLGQAAPGFTSA